MRVYEVNVTTFKQTFKLLVLDTCYCGCCIWPYVAVKVVFMVVGVVRVVKVVGVVRVVEVVRVVRVVDRRL